MIILAEGRVQILSIDSGPQQASGLDYSPQRRIPLDTLSDPVNYIIQGDTEIKENQNGMKDTPEIVVGSGAEM